MEGHAHAESTKNISISHDHHPHEHDEDELVGDDIRYGESQQWNNHYHVCEDDHNVFMPEGLSFDGVTGRVELSKGDRARTPIANMISSYNLQIRKKSNSP